MADDSTSSSSLIAGRFAVDPGTLLGDAGGGLPAYLARDRQAADSNRVALLVSRNASPRTDLLRLLSDPIDNLMSPLGHGVAVAPGGRGEAYYVVCGTPPGPPLSANLRPWPEKALVDLVLRPIARVLDTLHGLKITHRSIRLNNVFQGAAGQPVTLGAAWAAPAAMHQPAVFESPYQAICHPATRGVGTIGDDVYALGVLLLVLAGGKLPFAGQDEQTIIRWKLELGSYTALVKDLPISGFLADLLRGMLAEEAEHRPLPSLLLDPSAARGRRIAARPARRSQRPLVVNDIPAFEARTLAYALLADEKKAVQALRSDIVTTWLRRGLGDAGMASAIEELVRDRITESKPGPRSDALLVTNCIRALNPRMPFCWRGVALWADGLDGMLTEGVATESELKAIATELLLNDIVTTWALTQADVGLAALPPVTREVAMLRTYLQNGGAGALLRLYYTLNPLLPCRLPAMSGVWVLNVPDLLRFLDKSITPTTGELIDSHLAAFIAARSDGASEVQINSLIGRKGDAYRLSEVALLRDLQSRHYPHPLPALGKWVAARLRPELDKWQNRPKRETITTRLDALAQGGIVAQIFELVMDPAGRKQDEAAAQRAVADLATIDRQLYAIDSNDRVRFIYLERFGHAITGAIGLTALIMVVLVMLVQ